MPSLCKSTPSRSVPNIKTAAGRRSFAYAAPTIWNSLPFHIRSSSSLASFHSALKSVTIILKLLFFGRIFWIFELAPCFDPLLDSTCLIAWAGL